MGLVLLLQSELSIGFSLQFKLKLFSKGCLLSFNLGFWVHILYLPLSFEELLSLLVAHTTALSTRIELMTCNRLWLGNWNWRHLLLRHV